MFGRNLTLRLSSIELAENFMTDIKSQNIKILSAVTVFGTLRANVS